MKHSNIYFSVEDTKTAISDLEYLFSNYKVNRDDLVSVYDRYRDNDTHKGDDATAAKDHLNVVEMGFLDSMFDIKQKFLKMHNHFLETFAEKVDSHPNARMDIETLDKVQDDLCDFYCGLDSFCNDLDDITAGLQNRFGHMWDFKQPRTTEARESLAAICGGYDKNSGFIHEVKQKLIKFEEEESAYVDGLLLEDNIDDLQLDLVNSGVKLGGFAIANATMNVKVLNTIGKANAKSSSKRSRQKSNGSNHSNYDEQTIQTLMTEFGYTRQEAQLLNKALNALNQSSLSITDDPYARIAYSYGILTALCISYDAKRWRLTTGQETIEGAIANLKFAGLTDQEILDLRVLINLQHADYPFSDLRDAGIDVENSSFCNETHSKFKGRMKGNNNDFAHSLVQIAAFGHGDNMYENKKIDLSRWAVDIFNSSPELQFSYTMTQYEISFKGDIDSGRYSEEDFKSDVDAINLYQRMIKTGDLGLGTWSSYYQDIEKDSKQRAVEFFKNMGSGDADIGIINTSKVIEQKTLGSSYIQEGNETDISKAKSTFMQWIMSIYQGVDYDFPE